VNAGRFYGADVLIMGGDLTGKAVVPVIERAPGVWEAAFVGRRVTADTDERLAQLEEDIRFNGMYPYRCRSEEVEALSRDENAQEELIDRLAKESVAQWLRLADERLRDTGIQCYVMPGNDDPYSIDEVFRGHLNAQNCDYRVVELADGYPMISLSDANPTPWNSPRELTEDELAARIEALAEQVPDMRRAIFNLHVPPHASELDSAAELDEEFRPRHRGGAPVIAAVGSTAVREAIERHQPLLGLHGHIHESKGVTRIGRTTCLNPGSTYNTGRLDGALIELRGDTVRRVQMTSG
jgi:Icc-related predicted phosphoesterase